MKTTFTLIVFTTFLVSSMCYSLPSYEDNEEVNEKNLLEMTKKVHSIKMAEIALENHVGKDCFLRSICAVSSMDNATKVNEYSIATGIFQLRNLLRTMASEAAFSVRQSEEFLPNVHRTLSSYFIGAKGQDPELCDHVYPCQTVSSQQLIRESLEQPEIVMARKSEGRATCAAISNVCPGISIGCGLCSIFLPGTCSTQCTIAGIYCGMSGYACAAQASKTPR